MRKHDLYLVLLLVLLFGPFVVFPKVLAVYEQLNADHGIMVAFVKFAVLATLGESIGLRIRRGVYNEPGFGLLPRAVVWGFLGITLAMAFQIFAHGVPRLLEYMGVEGSVASMHEPVGFVRVLTAFSISGLMNVFYAPVFMTFHKITDSHIVANGGTLRALFRPIRFVFILQNLDWKSLWGFVFMRTIPFFWIPMHTITFCLPQQYRILIAAVLGVVLGVLLAVAGPKNSK